MKFKAITGGERISNKTKLEGDIYLLTQADYNKLLELPEHKRFKVFQMAKKLCRTDYLKEEKKIRENPNGIWFENEYDVPKENYIAWEFVVWSDNKPNVVHGGACKVKEIEDVAVCFVTKNPIKAGIFKQQTIKKIKEKQA